MILSESGPRSTTSPVWTRTASPPIQRPLSSTSCAARAMSRQAAKSPCRSPTATMRCKGDGGRRRRHGQGQGRHQTNTARPKPPQMRSPLRFAPVMLSDSGSMCKHRAELERRRVRPPRCICDSRAKNGVLSPIMHKIMIIRHAEKHQHGSHGQGVTEDGRPARHELTVRGWQRAAALVQLLRAGRRGAQGLADPDAPVDLRLERDQAKPQPAGDAHRRAAGRRAGH